MKLHYIGVRLPFHLPMYGTTTDRYLQIIKNENKPSHELCAEKDLSAYSRFTRNKYAYRR